MNRTSALRRHLAALLLLAAHAATAQNLVQNGGFESGDFTGWTPLGNFEFTTVVTNSTYVHSGSFGAQLGPTNALGFIYEDLPTVPNQHYNLSLWFNSPDGLTTNIFRVAWNGTNIFAQTNIGAIGWTNLQFPNLLATSNTARLRFGFQDDPSYLGLDDIVVTNATPVSPGPIAYSFSTFAGSTGAGTADGIGAAAQFTEPTGVAVDPAGNAYVIDSANTVRKVTPAGVVTTIAGEPNLGGSVDGPGVSALFRFYGIGAIAVDSSTNLYIGDTGNSTIRKMTLTGTNWIVSTIAGTVQMPGSSNGIGTNALFNAPLGLAVDSATNIYIADNFSIRELSLVGTNWVSSTIAGTPGVFGESNGIGVAAQFDSTAGIAIDSSTNLYVADTTTIRKVTPVEFPHAPVSWLVSTIAGFAGGYSNGVGTNALFDFPQGLAVDSSTNIYVADHNNNVVRKMIPSNSTWVVTTLAGAPSPFGSSNGTGTNASFHYPYGIAANGQGKIYLTDILNNEIRTLTSDGIVTTLAGSAPALSDIDGTGTAARFNNPQGVALDNNGNVYIADTLDETIRVITSAGVVTTPYGAPGVSGTNDGVGNNAHFYNPEALAVDNSGNIYVADTGNDTIRAITPDGAISTIAGAAGIRGTNDGTGGVARFNGPAAIALDAATNLYVADSSNYTVRLLTRDGTNWTSSTIAGKPRVQGGTNGAGFGARFYYLGGICVDSATNVYVTEFQGSPVRKLEQVGSNWVVSDYFADFTQLIGPYGITADGSGNLFVGNLDSTIQKLSPAGAESVATVIGGQSFTQGSEDGAGAAALFTYPMGIAVDPSGTLFVVDTDNNTIRKGMFIEYGAANPTAYTPPPMTGKLQVTLLPAQAGGQWRFPWETAWHNSGFTATNLASGNYPVEFRDIPGWLAVPANLTLTNPAVVIAGATTQITNLYYPTELPSDVSSAAGSLTVYLGANPPVGAGWRFLGDTTPFLPSNFTTNLNPGTYLLQFAGPFNKRATPSEVSVQILAGQPTLISVSYPFAAAPPSGALLPTPVPSNEISDLADYPFGFNGQVQSDVGFGSGAVVASNVVLTAAHLVFNDQTLSYVSGAYFFLQEDAPAFVPSPLIAEGWYVLSGYAAQRSNDLADGLVVDQSSPQSRNLDVAALYFNGPVAGGADGGFLPSDDVPNQWLTGNAEKMLVGYPVDGSSYGIATITPGTMYEIGPQPYPLTLDSEMVTNQQEVYLASWFLSFPGNSGGPLYVELNGYYYPAGVYVGTLNNQAVVRAIDSTVTNLIYQASLGTNGVNNPGGGVDIVSPDETLSLGNPGYLQIQLAPASAVQAGAAWLLQPSTNYSSATNFTVALFTTNAVTLKFKPIPGWNLPTNQTIAIAPGAISAPVAFYTVVPPKLVFNAQGIGLIGTTNTTYRIEKTASLKTPSWTGVSTNTIMTTNFNLVVSKPASTNAVFYRAVWLNR